MTEIYHILKNKLFYKIQILCLISLLIASCNTKTTKRNETKKEIVLAPTKNPTPKIATISPFEISMKNQGLVNLKEIDSSLVIDLKYSTKDNFFGEDVYGSFDKAFLQITPANAIKIASENLKKINPNYVLVIFDGARPHSIQQILWDKLDTIPPKKRKDFVADPLEGSIHNYGSAVDLSIFDMRTGSPIDMGTKFDYFGELAYPRLESKMLRTGRLTQVQIYNREMLRRVMISAGFEPITSEWWHFNFYSRKKAKELFKIVE